MPQSAVFKWFWASLRSYREASFWDRQGVGWVRKQDGEAKCSHSLPIPQQYYFDLFYVSNFVWKWACAAETEAENCTIILMLVTEQKNICVFSDTRTKPHDSIQLIYNLQEDRDQPSSSSAYAQAASGILHMMGNSEVLAEYMFFPPKYHINSRSY